MEGEDWESKRGEVLDASLVSFEGAVELVAVEEEEVVVEVGLVVAEEGVTVAVALKTA